MVLQWNLNKYIIKTEGNDSVSGNSAIMPTTKGIVTYLVLFIIFL